MDFVLAYPQAPIQTTIYMKIPKGITLYSPDGKQVLNNKEYVLALRKNLYGQKQAGRVWNEYLHEGLVDLGFTQSGVDRCVYFQNGHVFLVYVDDGIIAGPSKAYIEKIIKELGERFDVQDEGELSDYLGVNVDRMEDGRIKLSQPQLIQQIIEDLNFRGATKIKSTPAASTVTLHKDEQGAPHKATWHYRSVIGKLNFLEKSTRGELAYAVHQAARFCENPKESHTNAVHRIGRYLVGTQDEGIILNPKEPLFECYADADFCGLWNASRAEHDATTANSRTGYLISFAKCPIIWASKLQTEYALSTTEAEYISLSTALREVIPLMQLLEEFRAHNLISEKYCPKVYCKAFEDNSGALELAKTPRMRPRTKHINTKYHHFRSHVANGSITVEKIDGTEQLADLLTKPLPVELFHKFTELAMGWSIKAANFIASKFRKEAKDDA